MDTEKKAKLGICFGFILMVALTIICFVFISNNTANAEETEDSPFEPVETLQVDYTKEPGYIADGYSDLKTCWEDLLESRANSANELQDKIDATNGLSEDQLNQLNDLKTKLEGAANFRAIKKYKAEADEILSAAKPVATEKATTSDSEPGANTSGSASLYDGNSFKSQGVVYWNGIRYTWYSSNVLYHYRTPEWTVDSNGFYVTSDGLFVVASSDYPQGTIVDTPFGHKGIVLDSGCASGTIDMYTKF